LGVSFNLFFVKFEFFFFFKFFLVFLDHFDVLILKMNFKKEKNIILMFFSAKNTSKNNRHHTLKYPIKQAITRVITVGRKKTLPGKVVQGA